MSCVVLLYQLIKFNPTKNMHIAQLSKFDEPKHNCIRHLTVAFSLFSIFYSYIKFKCLFVYILKIYYCIPESIVNFHTNPPFCFV